MSAYNFPGTFAGDGITGMYPYFLSTNQNNTGPEDPVYFRERKDGFTSKYCVPTGSKLSRGKKGIIQRIFTGEPLNNLCNVYAYNETSKLWYHEDTILGNSTRRYPSVSYPPETMMTSQRTMNDGITYTATTSNTSSGRYFPQFAFGDTYETYMSYYRILSVYPTTNNQGLPNGSYTGSTSLGGVTGEWIKLQTSVGIQPTSFKLMTGGDWSGLPAVYQIPKEWTILGSNDDINWTNLGNFTIPSGWTHGDDIIDNLTISTTYTYFAVVLKRRNASSGGPNFAHIMVPNFNFILDRTSEDFGRSLDGTDNADMVAVGAPGTWFGSVSNINGYAYVFTKDSTGTGWTQRGSVVSQQGGFGHSIALSQKDGNILAVGAPFYNTLVPNNSGNIDFNSIPVSEGKVYIYKWDGSNYTLQQTLNSPSGTLSTTTPATWKNFYFGYSLGITNVGHKIIVGEPSIRSIWSVSDQLQGGRLGLPVDSFQYTGNAHVYDNVTVLDNGTTWTSNVSMTSVIGTTGIGLTDDTHPKKVRWLDALGVSVDVNRSGTRILAGAPGSYGTSNASPQVMSGRIYTLDWDQANAAWKEMGQDPKHVTASQTNMLLGWYTRFGGSGKRIIAGAPGYDSKGSVVTFDYDGYKWVSFPNETVEIETWINGSDKHRLGESISVDGESEMIAIGKDEHHGFGAPSRPNSFSVPSITYIGGATTTISGSNGQISTGMSNVWVYNIFQSMVIKGNATFDGNLQTSGISVGTNDHSSDGNKSIYLGGSQAENAHEMSVIENRVYETDEKTELLIFKGGDNANASGGGTLGPDRIRLKGGQIAFDLNTGYDRTLEDIRAVMHRNTGGAGMLGINVTSPTEVIHVDGKIKSTQGFIGRGRELTGLGFDYINKELDYKFNQAGATQSPTEWGEIVIGGTVTHPSVALTANISSGYTVTASRDVYNAYRAFDDNTGDNYNWTLGDENGGAYSNGVDPGSYIGTTERIAGYKGEWIELQFTDPIFLTQLDINCRNRECQPRIAYVFGSNDGIEYNLIHDTGDLGYLSFANNGNNTIFTRTPNYINDEPYNKILIILNMISGGITEIDWYNIDIYGTTSTFNSKVKIDNAGKIGIGTTTPGYALDVVGNADITGGLRANGSAGSSGQVLTSSGGGAMSWTTVSGVGGGSSLSGTNTFEWGTGVSGKQTDAGKIGYSTWGPGTNDALDIVGAGTTATDRAVRIYDKLGIGTSSPSSPLHVSSSQTISLDGTNYTAFIHMNRGSGNWYMATTNTPTWNQNLGWFANTSQSHNPIKRIFRFENDTAGAGSNGIISFTGQHVSPVIDITPTNVSNYAGLIVSSNQNDYLSINTTVPLRGAKNINVNEAIPVVKISTRAQDKACFGVISWGENPNEERREQKAGHLVNEWNKEKGDNRVYINSIGEGGVWIVNTNGNLEAGDYITTSNVSGYGMKQTSEFLANYTVAKITMDCNFNPGQVPVKQIKKVSATNTYYVRSTDNDTCTETFYNTLDDETKALYTQDVRTEMVNDIDSNGVFQWEDTSETELAYNIRYLDTNGIETTQENAVHIAAFVGCTYHCG